MVNWATTTAHGSTCNIFLGECLTLCGHERDAVHAGKYLSAQSYWMGHNRGFVHGVAKRTDSQQGHLNEIMDGQESSLLSTRFIL